MNTREMRSTIEQMKGQKALLLQQRDSLKEEERTVAMMGRKLEQGQSIVRTVALQTQQELQYHVSSITSMALGAVFPEAIKFSVEFVEKEGKTEAKAIFVEGGEQLDPMTEDGGGAVDIAAFSLRATSWKMGTTRPILVLDEPFRFVSQDLQHRAAAMLQEVCAGLGLQIIMVTHNIQLIEAADQVFLVTRKGPKSKVLVKGQQLIEAAIVPEGVRAPTKRKRK